MPFPDKPVSLPDHRSVSGAVYWPRMRSAMPGRLTLIGSGETAPGMGKLHRSLLKALPGNPRPVFLDTPAGFELGLQAIEERFRDYFNKRLGLTLETVSSRRLSSDSATVAQALATISRSNYLLAGPGSPTYAVRVWLDSPVFQAIVERWGAGAQLVFASAAAISLSRHVLPVYEIYKVGQELHWADGLDLLGPHGFELAIVTHWDNAEGGTHDTRACFMGLERFERLRQMLPPSAVVLGIDEHTACTLDIDAGEAWVQGRGGVTILGGDEVRRQRAGCTFPLSDLGSPTPSAARPAAHSQPTPAATGPTMSEAASRLADGDLAGGLRRTAEVADPELAVLLHQAAQAVDHISGRDDRFAVLVDLLLEARQGLRAAKEWTLADRLRDRLAEMGIEVRDTPEGAEWVRAV